jgi:hypothetical protein
MPSASPGFHSSLRASMCACVCAFDVCVWGGRGGGWVQNVARCPSVAETALAAISETALPATLDQIVEEKKIEDPELVRIFGCCCCCCRCRYCCWCCLCFVADVL